MKQRALIPQAHVDMILFGIPCTFLGDPFPYIFIEYMFFSRAKIYHFHVILHLSMYNRMTFKNTIKNNYDETVLSFHAGLLTYG